MSNYAILLVYGYSPDAALVMCSLLGFMVSNFIYGMIFGDGLEAACLKQRERPTLRSTRAWRPSTSVGLLARLSGTPGLLVML